MPHVPFIMPSACHSTPHCQQMNAGLYILSLLSLTDAGQNEVRILHLSRDAIIVSIHNVDEEEKETVFVAIIGMYGILKFPLPLSRHVPMPELSFRKSRGVDNIHSPVFVFVFTENLSSIFVRLLVTLPVKRSHIYFEGFGEAMYSGKG